MKSRTLLALAVLTSFGLSPSWGSADEAPRTRSKEPRPVVIRGANGATFAADRIVLDRPRPKAIPHRPAQVQLDVKVLTIDWPKLREAKLNLRQIIDALNVPDIRSVRDTPSEETAGDESSVTTAVFDRAVAENVVRLLKASGAVRAKFEPTVRTESGRAANVIDGVERPLARVEETVNGRTVQRVETLNFGTTLQITPNIRKDNDPFSSKGEIKLDVSAEYRQPLPAHQHPDDELPGVRVRTFQAHARLKDRQSLVIAEVAPFSKPKPRPPEPKPWRTSTDSEGVMLIVTASKVGTGGDASASNPVPASAVEAANPPAVKQAAAHSPRPVHHTKADRSGSLHRSVRELRHEVKQLRRDVHRLIEILEKRKEDEPEEAVAAPKMWKQLPTVRDEANPEKAGIQRALKKTVSFEFDEAPMQEVARKIASQADINVVLDHRGLEEEGITAETPVDLEVDDVSLRTVLELILEPLRLAYRIEDGVLKITSKVRSQGPLVVATYPVADLLIPQPKDDSEKFSFAGFDELKNLITRTVQPDSWSEVGGYASIRTFETTLSLVIRHTKHGHAEIAELLKQLRELQNFQVQLEPRLIRLPESAWKELGDPERFDSLKKKLRKEGGKTLLSEVQKTALLQAVQQHERGNLRSLSTKSVFNGCSANFEGFDWRDGLPRTLRVYTVISPDRRFVRLNNPQIGPDFSATVPDGKTVLWNLTAHMDDLKVPYIKRLFQDTGRAKRADRFLLLITPRIIPAEEEEEKLLGVPGGNE